MSEQILNSIPKPVLEAGKEFIRLLLFAIPGFLISALTEEPGLLGGEIGVGLLFLLRTLDRYIHTNPEIKAKGISPI